MVLIAEVGAGGGRTPWVSTRANDGERCPVVGAALAMAECTAGVVSASGAEKPPLRHPRGWSGRRMARQGVRAEGHCKVRPGIEPQRERESAG